MPLSTEMLLTRRCSGLMVQRSQFQCKTSGIDRSFVDIANNVVNFLVVSKTDQSNMKTARERISTRLAECLDMHVHCRRRFYLAVAVTGWRAIPLLFGHAWVITCIVARQSPPVDSHTGVTSWRRTPHRWTLPPVYRRCCVTQGAFAAAELRERKKNLFTAKQIINVTNKMNLCGRLPGRKFPSSRPPMLIQMCIIL